MYEHEAKFHSFVFECCEDLRPEGNELYGFDQDKLECLCKLLTPYIEKNKGGPVEMNVSTVLPFTYCQLYL